jgi:hypothetical protein
LSTAHGPTDGKYLSVRVRVARDYPIPADDASRGIRCIASSCLGRRSSVVGRRSSVVGRRSSVVG